MIASEEVLKNTPRLAETKAEETFKQSLSGNGVKAEADKGKA